jgi:hypothetical protein
MSGFPLSICVLGRTMVVLSGFPVAKEITEKAQTKHPESNFERQAIDISTLLI